jgi:tetratricopeptide (TPR) repeat protein
MKKLLSGTLLFLSLFMVFTAAGQQNNPLIVSGDLLQQGITLYDSGAYSKAVAVFSAIDRNDTNYVRALYNIGRAYYADTQYTKSALYSQQALKLHDDREMEPELYNQYGNSLNATNDDQRALEVFDSAIAKYPAYSVLYMNKAVVLMKLHRYPEAEMILQHVLVMDPYSYGSHFRLGLCAINEGKLIQAIFCLTGYLLMTPEGRYHSNCLSLLNAISHNTDEIQRLINDRKEATSDNYQLLEQIVQSKIALDKSYKPIIQLDDPISRQIQVIFEKMEYNVADSDFYTQYYIPFFKACYGGDRFEVFINHIFSSATNIPIIQEYNKKHKNELADLTEKAATYFNLIRRTR